MLIEYVAAGGLALMALVAAILVRRSRRLDGLADPLTALPPGHVGTPWDTSGSQHPPDGAGMGVAGDAGAGSFDQSRGGQSSG
jgi:hypothetical protein